MSAQYIHVKTHTDKPCPKCKGAKHIPNGDGSWRRCDCIRDALYRAACQKAGVAAIYIDVPHESLKPDALFRKLALSYSQNMVWLQGKLTSLSVRRAVAWLQRLYVNEGKHVRTYHLTDLIDAWFDRERKTLVRDDIKHADLLVLVVTNPLSHKVGAQAMEDVYAVRSASKGRTLFVSSDDIGNMPTRYGHEVAGVFRSRNVPLVSFRGGKVKP